MITGFYAGVLGVCVAPLIFRVVKRRMEYRISLGDGGNRDLQRHIRAHGNFIETVPFALLLMLMNELSGADSWFIHVLGVLLICGRGLHYFELTQGTGYGRLRPIGMAMTITVYLAGAIGCILLSLR